MADMMLRRRLSLAWRSLWTGPLTSSSPEIARLWASAPSSTGVGVSEQTALAYSAVWAAVSLISADVASLPLILYKRLNEGGKARFDDHRLYRLLHDEPNSEMTSMTWREILQAHLLTWGNAYSEIERDALQRPVALWPLTPDRVQPFRDPLGQIFYRVMRTSDNDFDVLSATDMLHIPGLGFDGLAGYSVIAKARESIGLGLACERFGGTFFGNGATFGGVFEHPGRMSEPAQKNFREAIEGRHQGVERAHKFIITEEGMKYQTLGVNPEDAQFLETRKFQIAEIARWFRVPPHKLGDLERSTNNNIEHQSIEYYTDCLRPWLVRWEQEINRKLIAPVERRIQFVEHTIDGVLRGDLKSRYDAYAVGRQWGWLSADDIADRENMNHLPNGIGKIYLVPLNMTPADRINQVIDAQIAAKTAPPAAPASGSANDAAVAAANARALAAEQSATAARDQAQLERDARIVAETTGTATAEELTRLRESEAHWGALAGQLTVMSEELRSRSDTLQAGQAELKTDLATAQTTSTTQFVELLGTMTAFRGEVAVRQAEVDGLRTAIATMTAECDRLVAAAAVELPSAPEDPRVAELTEQLAAMLLSVGQHETALTTAREALTAAEQRLTTETAARTQVETISTTQRQAELQRLTSVIGAHRGLIADAMGRMIRRETEKARRAQGTPEKLQKWIETFYPVHDDICRAALFPAIRTHMAWSRGVDDPVASMALTVTFVKQHIDESIRQLRMVLESDPEDVPMTLETTLRHWELDRADALADVILREEIDHVRSIQ